jgi:hypothetical protein
VSASGGNELHERYRDIFDKILFADKGSSYTRIEQFATESYSQSQNCCSKASDTSPAICSVMY